MSTKNVYVICRTDNKGEPLSNKTWFENRFICKIGLANDPEDRIQSLQTSNPFNLDLFANISTDNPKQLESILHKLYDRFNRQEYQNDLSLKGEWYYLNGLELTLLSSIRQLQINKLPRKYDLSQDKTYKNKIINKLSLIEKHISRIEDNTR